MKKCVFYVLAVFALSSCSTEDMQTNAIEAEIVQTDPLSARQSTNRLIKPPKRKEDFRGTRLPHTFCGAGLFREIK
ncbi:hypothetical protein [Chryseobacterium balustinum]|uniref:hypothetical protein n=1 Tax=Chryseobacterium balustinum TaxID=246 RepID=UPI003CF770F4